MAEEKEAPGIAVQYGAVTGQKSYRVRGPGSHIWYSSPQIAMMQYNKLKAFAAAGGFDKDRRK